MSNDETRFNELKVHFGSEGRADQLTLEEFAALSDVIAEDLLRSVAKTDVKIAGEISAIRRRTIQASQAFQQSVAVSQTTVHAPLQASGYDGLQDISTALPRTHLVATLFDMISNNRVVHLGAPAGSGKTSLLQLLRQYSSERGVTCIYASMANVGFRDDLMISTGINANTWRLEFDANGQCVCADSSKIFVVMFDDAQHQYDNAGLWAGLIKPGMDLKLPNNIRFVISATYSLGTSISPVDFRSLPKLVSGDFRLSQEEVDEFIRLSSVRMSAERAGTLLVQPEIRNMIATHCNGHIGALSVSVREIVKHFFHNHVVTVQEIVSFYLSNAMSSCFLRCYSSGVDSLPEGMRECLVRCLTMRPLFVPQKENPTVYRQLVRSGVLHETEGGRAKFASPAAASYINNLIFPHRSTEDIVKIRERGVFGLMKSVLKRMSGTTLRQSVVNISTDMPSEATFQHLMLAALEAETPAYCFICPELSKYFPPPPPPSHEMMDFDRSAAHLPEVKGRCDFSLNGDLRWAIEVLINGSGWGEHISLPEGQGKYVGLAYADYLVVDFRANATGEPTAVQRHERRMSVFFKQGDFTFCNVLCGSDPVEKITLAN